MHRRLLASVAVAALVLAGCGDDDDSAADDRTDEYAAAMAASMAEDDDLPFEQQDIDCLSVEFVEALGGAERLEAEGIEPEDLRGDDGIDELGLDLGEEEAEGIAAAFGNCDVSLAELVLAEAGDDVPPEVRDCVEENLDEDVLARFFAQVLVDDDASEDPPEELLEPLLACF
jgi:hypothetical protein